MYARVGFLKEHLGKVNNYITLKLVKEAGYRKIIF